MPLFGSRFSGKVPLISTVCMYPVDGHTYIVWNVTATVCMYCNVLCNIGTSLFNVSCI